jgi:DNA repair exonuclease SbcCD ATPase subunit
LKVIGVATTDKEQLVQNLVSVSERIGQLQRQLEALQQEMLALKRTAHDTMQTKSNLPYAHPQQRMAYLQKQSDQLLADYAKAMGDLRQAVSGNELMLREEGHAPELAVMGRLM